MIWQQDPDGDFSQVDIPISVATNGTEIVVLTTEGDIFIYDMMEHEWYKLKKIPDKCKLYGTKH